MLLQALTWAAMAGTVIRHCARKPVRGLIKVTATHMLRSVCARAKDAKINLPIALLLDRIIVGQRR